MELFGIRLVGVNVQNGQKLLLTLALVALVVVLRRLFVALQRALRRHDANERIVFWTRQGTSLFLALLLILGIASIWFNDPARLTTALGLVSAGLAFALQKVVTAVAGYFTILRGNNFRVGDRIAIGGVRGDVIALGFLQTTIMEMGQPPPVQGAAPDVWVRSRQFTGRIVTVSNGEIFDEPVYNYTRDFPYLWEEIVIPVTYTDDRRRAEAILLEAAAAHTVRTAQMGEAALGHMRERYGIGPADLEPRVYWRITDNWLELTVRFVVESHGVRGVKDAVSRDILDAFDATGIGIASATYDIVGLPPVELRGSHADSRGQFGSGSLEKSRAPAGDAPT